MRTWFEAFEGRVRNDWAHLGEQTTASGVRCVGRVPEVGRAAWLHRFYPPCPDVDALESRIGRPVPDACSDLLSVVNGMASFITRLTLYGVRPDGAVSRSIDDPPQFSIVDANTMQRPTGNAVASTDFVMGGSSVGNGAVYVLRDRTQVVKLTRDGAAQLGDWPDIASLFEDEYAALQALHDSAGTYHRPP